MTGGSSGAAGPLHAQGVYFDGRSSRPHPARVQFTAAGVALSVDGEVPLVLHWPAPQVSVDPALPGVRRSFKFPDGSRFETPDNDAVRQWERLTGRNRVLSGVRGLEARWSSALGALVVAGALMGAFVVWGIPALAGQAARVTPRSVLTTFDRETLKLLNDQELLGPSRLSAARQAQLQAAFRPVRAWAGGGYTYRLLLRDGEPGSSEPGEGSGLGANAFALPGGTIVMTDQLVALARSDRELVGVLAHETGHVTERHGVAAVYQALGISLVITVLTGDLVSASTFAAAVPAAILQSGYSRAAETESDRLAAAYMRRAYGTTAPLQAILKRLDAEHNELGDSSLLNVLRSHPVTEDRIELLKSLDQQP